MSFPVQGDKCNTLLFRHKCPEDDNDENDPPEHFENIEVGHCANLFIAQIDNLVGVPDGCEHLNEVPPYTVPGGGPSIFVDSNITMRDVRAIHVQTLAEVNLGQGIDMAADVNIAVPGTILRVREIQEAGNVSGHVPIHFIGVSDINEYMAGLGLIIRPNTNFVNGINFGAPPGGELFQYDRETAAVTLAANPGGGAGPNIVWGNLIFHRYGASSLAPMVTVVFGTASVVYAHDGAVTGQNYLSTAVVIPVGYRPTQDFYAVIPSFRGLNGDALPANSTNPIMQSFLVFRADGRIMYIPIAAANLNTYPRDDLFGAGDTGNTIGIRAGSVSYECVAS